uniref:L1 transposable element RRM domain-containing protein n=1 Tax=Poecilia formosa TaxID=48698 RepID=A0A096M5G9_POEFO
MRSRKTQASEDLVDIKKSLDFLSEEVTAIWLHQNNILDLVKEVKSLRLLNKEKDKRIAVLENQVADLEQFSKINDVIITGLRVKPCSYANTVAAPSTVGEPSVEVLDSTEKQVVCDCDTVEAWHPLPRRGKEDKPAIIMRFIKRKYKFALLKQGRLLKGSHVFINEHLTKKNADIARKARFLRKQATWTTDCKVFVKLNGAPEEAKILVVRDIA